jgi:hypothetical protein
MVLRRIGRILAAAGQSHVDAGHTCGTGILPVGLRGIGILPMVHGLEAHATLERCSHAIALLAVGSFPRVLSEVFLMRIETVFRLFLVLAVALSTTASGSEVVTWDFSKGLHGWKGNSYVAGLAVTAEGLAFRSTGIDPWIEGPAIDLPGTGLTRVRVRMKSDADPHGELFYGPAFQAGRSVRFTVQNDGQWHEYALLIAEPLGRGTRLRLDPAASAGQIVVAWIRVETLSPVQPPQFRVPERPARGTVEPASVTSGALRIEHYRGRWGDFVIQADGVEMAAGYTAEMVGLMLDGQAHWLELNRADFSCVAGRGGGLSATATLAGPRGEQWRVTRNFKAGPHPGSILVETTFVIDTDSEVLHLPWLTLFPGLGTFGQRKAQGLLAGLEYLDDEPSSSQADLTTPEHVRRVPEPVKITFPLMAIGHEGRYVGLIWEPSDAVAAVFDSPDRIYSSGAHVMALSAPGVGDERLENALVALTPFRLAAHQPLTVRTTLIGGRGQSIVPAVRKYVEIHGLPPVPHVAGGLDAAVTLLAHGWLDSAINEGGLFRHAVWGESFKAGPAGDAIMFMDWLANHAGDPDLVSRLRDGRDLAMTRMPPGQPYMSGVSHVRPPMVPMVFGGVPPYVERRRADAGSLLARFDEQGIKEYQPGKIDYSRTHFANHANGHSAPDVANILEAATLAADRDLVERGLALLDKQTSLYANTVPRGAQVWEIPLHTPDILACAHLVKAYTLGYMISGNPAHLEQARYWAWTGVPFVYLANPTEGEVGHYATIAVLGATNWQAPVWLGLPVQWCGLVYASALHLLSEQDREGPWATIAKGITAASLQMTWPTTDRQRQGLLPDFFHLRAQISDGPAINPGTVQAHVPELFDRGTLYSVRRLENTGWFLHAPCAIRDLRETEGSISFIVDGWSNRAFHVLLSGVERAPTATIRPLEPDATPILGRGPGTQFNAQQGLLTITLSGPAEIELRF